MVPLRDGLIIMKRGLLSKSILLGFGAALYKHKYKCSATYKDSFCINIKTKNMLPSNRKWINLKQERRILTLHPPIENVMSRTSNPTNLLI